MNWEEFVAKCDLDHQFYAERHLWIQTAEPRIIPLRLNTIQQKLNFYTLCLKTPPSQRPLGWDKELLKYNKPEVLNKQHRYIRANVLKARREGLSTYIATRGFKKTHLTPATRALIVAHHKDSTLKIYQMSQLFYDKLPTKLKLPTKYYNKNELAFAKTHSSLTVQTASEVDVSRASGFSFIHCSELAFWENADATMIALLQTMQEYDGTEWWNESTPNGQGGKGAYFYDFWNETKQGKNDYVNFFFSWFDAPENSKEFFGNEKDYLLESMENGKEIPRYGEELKIMENFGLTLEQMNWRRWYIRNKCKNDINIFNQEYPQDDESCFLSSGGSFFNVNLIIGYEKLAKEGKKGDLYYKDGKKEAVRFSPNPRGFITYWEEPERVPLQNRYAMGWDINIGVDDGDFTCGMLIDRRDVRRKHILEWHGKLPPDLIAEELLKISMWFGDDIWHCIERQGEGNAVIQFIRDKYLKLYVKRQFGKMKDKEVDMLGFDMTAHGKQVVLPNLNAIINQDMLECYNQEFWNECKSFMRSEAYIRQDLTGSRLRAMGKGSTGRLKRRFDDRVIAMALAFEMDATAPPCGEDRTKLPKWLQELHHDNNKPATWLGA